LCHLDEAKRLIRAAGATGREVRLMAVSDSDEPTLVLGVLVRDASPGAKS